MKRILFSILFLLSLTLMAQEKMIGNSVTKNLLDQMEQVSENELIRINIRLTDQYDVQNLEEAFPALDRAGRRALVTNELKSFSQLTQKGILDLIDQRSKTNEAELIYSLWINNVITAMASKDLIFELSQRSDIDRIDWDEERNLLMAQERLLAGGDDFPEGTLEITYNVNIMNVPAVWAAGFEGEGVVVGVIDTGVNYNHADLQSHMWTHPSYPYFGYDFVNGDNNPMDDHGHGTHCAGTVAGDGTAGSQTGMAPKAKIMALKVLSSGGSGSESGVWAAVQFGVDYGADVLSLSLGWQQSWGPDRQSWRNSFNNALAAGVISSVAAGNEGTLPGVPNNLRTPGDVPPPWLHPDQTTTGGLSGVVSVGATDSGDNIASFSSRGPVTWQTVNPFNDYPYNPGMGLLRPDVTAPGVDVKSCTYNNNFGYTFMSGTSMATPGVAGVMALLLSKNPNLTPAQISEALEMTSVDLGVTGKDNTYGAGRVNALAAINYINYPGPVYSSHSITDPNSNGQIEAGESILLSIEMYNGSDTPRTNVNVTISTDSPYIMITDNSEFYGNFATWQYKTVTNGFAFSVAANTPGMETIRFNISATDGIDIWNSFFDVVTYGPRLEFGAITISDPTGNNNGRLDPGETVDLLIVAQNTGQVPISNVLATIGSASGYITINTDQYNIPSIPAGGSVNAVFNLSVSAAAPIGAPAVFNFNMVSGVYDAQKSETLIIGQIPVLILNLDPNNNSAPAMQTALAMLGVAYDISTSLPPDLNIYSSVFVCLGIYPNNTVLSASQGTTLANYLNNGGQIYMEGGDTWYYDPSTPVHGMFNINPVADGSGDMGTILGQAGTFTEGMSFVYSGENNWMDRIGAIAPAYLILQNQSPSYGTGVANNPGTYRTIGTSHEFGGLTDGTFPSTREELMNQYLTFFGITGIPTIPPIINVNPLSLEVTLPQEATQIEVLNISNLGDETLTFAITKNDLPGSKSVQANQDLSPDDIAYETEIAVSYEEANAQRIAASGAQNANPVKMPYLGPITSLCAPTYAYGCSPDGDGFTDFALEQIQNLNNGCANNTGQTGWSTYYNLGPALLDAGETYTVSIRTGYSSQYVNIWIDFNDDNILTSDELVLVNFLMTSANTWYYPQITIPETLVPGQYRMRAMAVYGGTFTNPCGSYYYGEAEDYYVMINSNMVDWLSFTPGSGSVPGSGSAPVDLTFNSSGLEFGTYYANVIVSSNDLVTPTVIIPCTLNVVGDINVGLTAMLEGGSEVSTMSTYLNTAGLLPLTQPYNTSPWNYSGTESVAAIPNADVVDWVLVELRETNGDANAATPAAMIARQAGFILNDGSIVDIDGSSMLRFDVVVNNNLFVVIHHRNHLGIMSANPVVQTGGDYLHDFTTGSGQAHGGSNAQKELQPGVWGMISGDINADGTINMADKSPDWDALAGEAGYYQADLNFDGQVNNMDKDDFLVPNLGKSSMIPN
ncbi:MAG: S8 family serine peptidase [Bacteroidales bacterium]